MNPDLKAILSGISSAIDEGAELAKHTYDGIRADVRDLGALGEVRLLGLIDKVVDDEAIRRMAKAFYANVQKGRAVAVDGLRREHAKYERKLNGMVADNPETVGFWDGFVCIFLAVPANRRSESDVYNTHARYGKVVGVASAVLLFLPAGGIRAVLGALPVVVRGAQYLQKKVMDAKDKVKQGRSAGSGNPVKAKVVVAKRARRKAKPSKTATRTKTKRVRKRMARR